MSSGRSRSGGKVDLDDAEAVVEVFAERAIVDHLTGVAVRRSNDPHVDGNHPRAAHALHLACFEHTQELRLKTDVELADFVQEERAAIGHFEAALLAVGRTGKGAAFVAKQNAFDEVRGDRAAVLHDEGPLCALRRAMNGARNELLAGARLAANEHGEVRSRHLLEDRENLAHSHAVSDEVVELLPPAEVDLDRARAVLEADYGAPDPQWHARFEPCLTDANASDPGAVRRA